MFAIIRHGYGKKRRFAVHALTVCELPNGQIRVTGFLPMRWDVGIHKTEEAARRAAEKSGITVDACGDLYEVSAQVEKQNNEGRKQKNGVL